MNQPTRRFDSGKRLLFLLAVVSAFVLLPMRHVIIVDVKPMPGGTGPAGVHRSRPPTVDALTVDLGGSSFTVDSDAVAVVVGNRGGVDGDVDRARLLQELRIDVAALPHTREPSLQQRIELSGDKAGGVYRNPYLPLKRSNRPCLNGAHTRGRWVYDEARRTPYPGVGEILGSCQRGYEASHGPKAQRPETKYRWVPDSCDLIPFTEENFCKALRGRDIMFAGDSLNDHWHASLVYLLGLHGKDIYKREGTVGGKYACGTHPICGKYYPRPLKVYFLTNQLLLQTSMRRRNHKWWKWIRTYPLLVLNSGSWMRDPHNEEREVSDEEWQGHMQHALKLVRALYNGTVIWRTTYQGHPYCWRYTEPLTHELAAEDFPVVAPYKRYRWAAIPGRNNFTTNLWREAGAHVLDVTRPTNLMPLGHLGQNHPKFQARNTTDCLHYCSPGPYDLWSELLMNLLLGNIDG
jgi:hypothetical protein